MQFPHLFSPIRVGRLTLKHRLVAAPSLPCLATVEGAPSRELIDYYRAKARGGAALVTVGESAVDREYAVTHGGQLVIDSDKMIPWLSQLAEAIGRYGAVASLELSHGGRQTLPDLIGGRNPIAPSPVPSKLHELLAGRRIAVQEMDAAMMEVVKENFANAALRLKRAGFDMCLLHGGHGWLLAQFLSPLTNKRTDEYGGSLANRARFPLEIIDRVREKVGPDFAIEYRLSGEELVPGGLGTQEAVAFAQMIEDKVDLIHVSTGMMGEYQTIPYTHPTNYLDHGHNVYLAAMIKKAVKVPVACVGSLSDPAMADRIIAEGKADIVAMARALQADPELPDKARRGALEEIIPCTRCLECWGRVSVFRPLRCAANPVTGRETELAGLGPARRSKKVLVAGGGPAGMQAAITAALRGHRVTLYEKGPRLGGNLVFADHVPFKKDLRAWRDHLITRVNSLPIKVVFNTPLDARTVRAEGPDALIVGIGGAPLVPDSPGVAAGNVLWAGDVYAQNVVTGPKVVIVGGGMVGCETALFLSQKGQEVVVVEMRDEVAVDVNMATRLHLLELLAKASVRICTRARCEEITGQGIRVADREAGDYFLAADTVVLALGLQPQEVEGFRDAAPEVYFVGDCRKPGKVLDAVHGGFNVASEL